LETTVDELTINGRTYTTILDANLNRVTMTSPEGREMVASFDTRGLITEEHATCCSYPVHYTYDANQRVIEVRKGSGSDPAVDRTYNLSYNAEGYIETITDPLGRIDHFLHDKSGRVIEQEMPGGLVVGFSYDAIGNLVSMSPPGRPSHSFTYTSVNMLDTYSPPDVGNGITTTDFDYSLERELSVVLRPDGKSKLFDYNETSGKLESITYPGGVVSFTYYPSSGNLHTVTLPSGDSLEHIYDGYLLTEMKWTGFVSGTVSFGYNNNLRVSSQSINGTQTVVFGYDTDDLLTSANALNITYDPNHALVTETVLNNVTTSRTYNGFGELQSLDAIYNGTLFFDAEYMHDALGRIIQRVETWDGSTSNYNYLYDEAGRLEYVFENGEQVSHFLYDTNGNRLSHTTAEGTVAGSYDDQDRMLSYGTTEYTYTKNGELLTKTIGTEKTTYDYDVFGNLLAVDLPGGNQFEIKYLIDGQNRRIGKMVDGNFVQGFLYQDQLNPVAELDGNRNVVSRFVYGTRVNVPDYMVKGGATYRIISDHLGSPRIVINALSGEIAQKMDYDAFGKLILDTNPGFQPFGFAGGIYDYDTGLVRFGARDYDPTTGRWTTKDPLLFPAGATNVYEYVKNNPVSNVDFTGLECVKGWLEKLTPYEVEVEKAYTMEPGTLILDPTCPSGYAVAFLDDIVTQRKRVTPYIQHYEGTEICDECSSTEGTFEEWIGEASVHPGTPAKSCYALPPGAGIG
jgi:RHS repeat-associated protein